MDTGRIRFLILSVLFCLTMLNIKLSHGHVTNTTTQSMTHIRTGLSLRGLLLILLTFQSKAWEICVNKDITTKIIVRIRILID